jgi:hypothetical protein
MKIILDRRSCNCWEPACEAHFGWHFLREEITPVDCTVEMLNDGQDAITFFIKDRDGLDKELRIDEHNRAEAYDSWRQAWEQQQAQDT